MSNVMQKLRIGSELRSVLIIDDDPELASSLSRILKMFFKECVVAKDGEEALNIYKLYVKNSKPFSLVVTDLELPIKGGLSLIKDIRNLVKSQAILILSAHDDAQFMAEAISLDVNGYLLKPLSMPKLFENLEKILLDTDTYLKSSPTLDSVTGYKTLQQLESFLDESNSEDTFLLRIKINYLTNIYNIIGEEYADEYLKELASLLESLNIDSKNVFYRISLDELALVLQTKASDATALAKDMVSVAKYFHTSENGIIINSTLSIGIANGSKDLLKYSKLALEESYSDSSKNVFSYTQSDYEKNLNIVNGREIMKMIFNAIENNTIAPCVQPMLNVKTDTKDIFNSYVRIKKDDKMYGPNTFLSIAQNAHNMSMITRSMIKNTLALYKKLNQKNIILVIHLSIEDFFEESLLPYIIFWSEKNGIDPSNIGFEVLFTHAQLHSEKQFSLIFELKKRGFKIILNRFGLDKCNLSAILDLKPDYIKIHTDLIQRLEDEPKSIATIQQLIDIIHLIGSKAIAAHIATDKQLELIKTTNVDYMQGYAICGPYEVK